MKPSAASASQSRCCSGCALGCRPAHQAMAANSGAEYSIRNASSDVGSTNPCRYASLTRMALNEKPSTPTTAQTGPIHAPRSARGATPASPRRASRASVPADDATPGGVEDQCAERDAVPRERHEVVMAHVAQRPAYAQECGHERRREPDAECAQVLGRQQRAIAHEFVRARREER